MQKLANKRTAMMMTGGDMENKSNCKNENGFSLVELLLAFAIFAIGSLSAGVLFYSTSGSARHTSEISEAVFIAQDYLNQTLALKYRDISGSGNCTNCMAPKSNVAVRNYVVNVAIDPVNPPANGTAKISVTVSWKRLWGAMSSNSVNLQYVRAETISSGI